MRMRTMKPGFFTNDELAEVEPLGRILFAGLWCMADREGRLEYRPKRIKAEVLPYDDCNIIALLEDLERYDFIRTYKVKGERFIIIPKFLSHQCPNQREAASVLPPPPPEILSQCFHNESPVKDNDSLEHEHEHIHEHEHGGTATRACAHEDVPPAAPPLKKDYVSVLKAEGWTEEEIKQAQREVVSRANPPTSITDWAGYLRPILKDRRNGHHTVADDIKPEKTVGEQGCLKRLREGKTK